MSALAGTIPILSCDEARALEAAWFAGDEAREWSAMRQAGRAIAHAVLRDYAELGGFPPEGRLLVLAGKGHNGGDAMIAAEIILREYPAACADVRFVFGERALRPLAARAWRELVHSTAARVWARPAIPPGEGKADGTAALAYDLCLDGVFGFQFRPPADAAVTRFLARINALPIRLRAAVDLPSAGLFRADFTYATGSVKAPVVDAPESGRVRYLNLGFFRGDEPGINRALTAAVLVPLAGLSSPRTDKRTYGHVFIVGGSRSYPGAVLMTVLAALRSGAGLVTAFVPESVAAAFAARAPEAMWVGWPETRDGGLALEGECLLQERLGRASALVIGPGLGREPETLALATSIVQASQVPLVIDADALQSQVVRAGQAPRIVTPHQGEFERISGGVKLREFAADTGAIVVLKGPVTRIASWAELRVASELRSPLELQTDAELRPSSNEPAPEDAAAVASLDRAPESGRRNSRKGGERVEVYHSFFGGPVLARGGSGDVLAGLVGGLLAQTPNDPLLAAARGVVWHGRAADLLACAQGSTSARVTQLLDFLSPALRESAHDP